MRKLLSAKAGSAAVGRPTERRIARMSDQHQPFVGDAARTILTVGAEDHLVMRSTRRDHREAVLVLVDHDLAHHRTGMADHLADAVVELAEILDPHPARVKTFSEHHEIRQRLAVAFGIARSVQQLLPLPHHAHVAVVQDEHFDW